MIFIANVLSMNGGTTFLIRVCREFRRRGILVAVLVLFPIVDEKLKSELGQYARVIDLRDYLWDRGKLFRAQFMTFAPVRWAGLLSALRPYGNTVHAMGVFGMLFSFRALKKIPDLRVTTGVYHQNEYLFEAGNSIFIRILRRCFLSLPANQILFFNQINVVNYEKFFERSFSTSLVAPIGIDLPDKVEDLSWAPEVAKLVSIGNLVKFKTYNRHVIGVVANLTERYPALHYDIYGAGPEEEELRELVRRLGVQKRVHFKGVLPYSEFGEVVHHATVFIGSGTALIEAAALGVPALVGIESIQTPETYGFLSNIQGLSYNEYMPDMARFSMLDAIDNLLSSPSYAIEVSGACKKKAREFSVEKTVDAFEVMNKKPKNFKYSLSLVGNISLGFSFFLMALLDRIGLSSAFRNRRDQSF